MLDVPMPSVVKHYNQFMGGVDLSYQLIGYHCILRQTKYWKTLLYHLLEDGITNAFVLHKWQLMMQGTRTPSESLFRDKVVLLFDHTAQHLIHFLIQLHAGYNMEAQLSVAAAAGAVIVSKEL